MIFFCLKKIEQSEDESTESPSDKAPQGERTANIVIAETTYANQRKLIIKTLYNI